MVCTSSKCCWSIYRTSIKYHGIFMVIHKVERSWPTVTMPTNGNISHVTGPLWGESIGHQWIPLIKASDTGLFDVFLDVLLNEPWANNRDTGDLRCHCIHYNFTVMPRNPTNVDWLVVSWGLCAIYHKYLIHAGLFDTWYITNLLTNISEMLVMNDTNIEMMRKWLFII